MRRNNVQGAVLRTKLLNYVRQIQRNESDSNCWKAAGHKGGTEGSTIKEVGGKAYLKKLPHRIEEGTAGSVWRELKRVRKIDAWQQGRTKAQFCGFQFLSDIIIICPRCFTVWHYPGWFQHQQKYDFCIICIRFSFIISLSLSTAFLNEIHREQSSWRVLSGQLLWRRKRNTQDIRWHLARLRVDFSSYLFMLVCCLSVLVQFTSVCGRALIWQGSGLRGVELKSPVCWAELFCSCQMVTCHVQYHRGNIKQMQWNKLAVKMNCF